MIFTGGLWDHVFPFSRERHDASGRDDMGWRTETERSLGAGLKSVGSVKDNQRLLQVNKIRLFRPISNS